MKDHLQDEIPKHKKKSNKKTPKKSNHKHDYKEDRREVTLELVNVKFVKIYHKCTVCGKEKVDSKLINK